jgi:hypothetical protein
LPARTLPVVAAASVALMIIDLIAAWVLTGRDDDESVRWGAATGFETSHGMAAWWSSLLLLLVAQLAYTHSRTTSEGDDLPLARRWQVLAVLFVWTSFDHATHAHVEVARQAATHLQLPDWSEPLTFLLLLAAAIAGGPVFRAASSRARRRLLAGSAAFVGGAWAVDAALQLSGASPGLASRALECGLEWTGLIVLIAVLIDPTAWRERVSR